MPNRQDYLQIKTNCLIVNGNALEVSKNLSSYLGEEFKKLNVSSGVFHIPLEDITNEELKNNIPGLSEFYGVWCAQGSVNEGEKRLFMVHEAVALDRARSSICFVAKSINFPDKSIILPNYLGEKIDNLPNEKNLPKHITRAGYSIEWIID